MILFFDSNLSVYYPCAQRNAEGIGAPPNRLDFAPFRERSERAKGDCLPTESGEGDLFEIHHSALTPFVRNQASFTKDAKVASLHADCLLVALCAARFICFSLKR